MKNANKIFSITFSMIRNILMKSVIIHFQKYENTVSTMSTPPACVHILAVHNRPHIDLF